MSADLTYQPGFQVRHDGNAAVTTGHSLDIESGGSFKIAGTAMTASAAELNAMAGAGLSAAELGVLDGVTAGTAAASKALVLDGSLGITTITSATITTLTSTAVNSTTVSAGASGTAGTVQVFPTTAAKGKVTVTASDATGNTTTNINVAAQAAARTYTVPDAGASASFVLTQGTQTIAGALTLTGGLTLTTTGATITDVDIALGTTTGSKIGTATAQKLAFHNSTPVVQRVGAAQAAVITTASTQTTPYGYATQAQADALVTLVNELRAALVEKGLIKGAA